MPRAGSRQEDQRLRLTDLGDDVSTSKPCGRWMPLMRSAAWPPVPVLTSVGRFDPLVAESEITCRTIARSLPGSPITNTQVNLARLILESTGPRSGFDISVGTMSTLYVPAGTTLYRYSPFATLAKTTFLSTRMSIGPAEATCPNAWAA